MHKLGLTLLVILTLTACGESQKNTVESSTATVPSVAVEVDTASDNSTSEKAESEELTKSSTSVDTSENITSKTSEAAKDTTKASAIVKPTVAAPLIVNIDAGNFFFKPSTINAKVGQKVTVNFNNSGFHDFSIDALGINVDLRNKSTGTVTFTPTKAGTFEYYCSVPGHKASGMKGSLVVTE